MKLYVVLFDPDGVDLPAMGATLDLESAYRLLARVAREEGLPEEYYTITTAELYGENAVITQDDIESEGD